MYSQSIRGINIIGKVYSDRLKPRITLRFIRATLASSTAWKITSSFCWFQATRDGHSPRPKSLRISGTPNGSFERRTTTTRSTRRCPTETGSLDRRRCAKGLASVSPNRTPHADARAILKRLKPQRHHTLFREHLMQVCKDGFYRCLMESSESLEESLSVNGAKLVQRHKSGTLLEAARDAPGVGVAASRHRRNYDRSQVLIQFIRRDDQTRPGLADFTAKRWIKTDQVNLASLRRLGRHYQVHSSASKTVTAGLSSRASSPRLCIARAASAQPCRG